jgi:uncharacterized membrane protein
MNTSEQLNLVVDNLASKIGVAAETLRPIAETAIREVWVSNVILGSFLIGFGLVLLLAGIVIFRRCFANHKQAQRQGGYLDDWVWAGGVSLAVSLIAWAACWGVAIDSFYRAARPTLTLLETLR